MLDSNVIKLDSFTKTLNERTFNDYFFRLMLIARSIFKWNNLPNGIDEKWIERFLFMEGNCIFYKDKEKGFMVAKATPSGNLNYYDEPTKLTPYGTNYMGRPLQNNIECVLIRNNDIMLPTRNTVELYAYKLAEISRTIDINVSGQKYPYVVISGDKKKLSFKNVFKKVQDNEPVVYVDNNLDINMMKVLDMKVPVVFPDLQIQKHDIWNECMTFLGVNNANMDKRERLVDDEVQANNDQILISGEVMLKSRKQACKQINELFGLNVSVEMRTKADYEQQEEQEGDFE